MGEGVIYLVSLIQLIIFFLIRRLEKHILSPSVIFSFLIFLALLISLITAPGYYFSLNALLFITLCIISFATGSIIINGNFSGINLNKDFIVIIYKLLFVIGLLAGMLSIFSLIRDSGYNITEIFFENKLRLMSQELTRSRYQGARLSMLTMFLLLISYTGAFASGYLFILSVKISHRLVYGLILIPVLIFTLIYTARAVLLFSLLNFIGGVWMAFVSDNISIKKYFKYAIIGILSVVFVFVVTQSVRMGTDFSNFSNIIFVVNYLKVWLSGNFSSFSIWFDQSIKSTYSYGLYTFAGLFELLGMGYRVPGIYHTTFDVSGQMEFSNIYTLFRFVIDDWGLGGCLLFFFILGFVSKVLFQHTRKGNILSGAICSGIIVLLLWSLIASVWAYNTMLFSWILFVFVNLVAVLYSRYFKL